MEMKLRLQMPVGSEISVYILNLNNFSLNFAKLFPFLIQLIHINVFKKYNLMRL